MSNFTFELALELYNSTDSFPVDFDDAWEWYEFSRKDSGLESFKNCGFVENIDFISFPDPKGKPQGGRPRKIIKMTIDCFKSWGMMIGTPKGKEVRRYFLECEKVAKQSLNQIQNLLLNFEQLIDNAVNSALTSRLEKIDEYEKACEEHDGAGYVIQSNVSKKTYPSEAVTSYEYCALKKLDRKYWRTFSRRYAQFVRIGRNEAPPKRNGKLLIYGELYYYAEMTLANVMEIV